MRSDRAMLWGALSLGLGLAACVPVEKAHPPPVAAIGSGKVIAARDVTGETGESRGDRALQGLIEGGLTGAVAGAAVIAEDNFGQSSLHEYDLRMADGTPSTLRSFSSVTIGDCVKVSKVGDKPELVLERIDVSGCAEVKH